MRLRVGLGAARLFPKARNDAERTFFGRRILRERFRVDFFRALLRQARRFSHFLQTSHFIRFLAPISFASRPFGTIFFVKRHLKAIPARLFVFRRHFSVRFNNLFELAARSTDAAEFASFFLNESFGIAADARRPLCAQEKFFGNFSLRRPFRRRSKRRAAPNFSERTDERSGIARNRTASALRFEKFFEIFQDFSTFAVIARRDGVEFDDRFSKRRSFFRRSDLKGGGFQARLGYIDKTRVF